MRKQLDGQMSAKDPNGDAHMEMVKSMATMEQVIKDLKGQVSGKEQELRRIKAESQSLQKRLEKVRRGMDGRV